MGNKPMPNNPSDSRDKGSSLLSAEEWRDGRVSNVEGRVAEEVPVAFEFNRMSYAVMLATPADLDDFALGFSLTEGIVDSPEDFHNIEIVPESQGIILRLTVARHCFNRLREQRRNLAGRTGCGLCGAENLEQVVRQQARVDSRARFSVNTLQSGFELLKHSQPLMQATGASHAAGWLDADGNLVSVREDVGRHNALDKLFGALVREGIDVSRGAALITSRASYEMVQKAASLGVGVLAAISAPTGLAIRLAQSSSLTLAGFVRADRLTVYAGGERIIGPISRVDSP
jgi:FdhD protein